MAAHEDEIERVVMLGPACFVRGECDLLLRRHEADDDCLAMTARGLGTDVIDKAARGDLDEPAARVVGHAVTRPVRRRSDERFLQRVLARGEVAEASRDRAEHLRRELA